MAIADDIAMKVPAVVLAGGINDQSMRDVTGVETRALVELTPGKTMLDYVLSAAKNARSVSTIVVAGDVPKSSDYTAIAPGPTFLDNLMRGVAELPSTTEKVLIVTSDIPFITGAALDDFVSSALASGADLCYPIIPMDIYRHEFGGMKRTTLKLRDGEFTGGNIILMSADYVRNHQQTILQAYAARKDVLKLGRMLGWGLLLKVIASQAINPNLLDIATLEKGVSNLLGHGARAAAIITQYASLGTDVDKPGDIVEARRILAADRNESL